MSYSSLTFPIATVSQWGTFKPISHSNADLERKKSLRKKAVESNFTGQANIELNVICINAYRRSCVPLCLTAHFLNIYVLNRQL